MSRDAWVKITRRIGRRMVENEGESYRNRGRTGTVPIFPLCMPTSLRYTQARPLIGMHISVSIVKGSGRGGQQQALGEEGDFAVHASVYGEVQAEPNVND